MRRRYSAVRCARGTQRNENSAPLRRGSAVCERAALTHASTIAQTAVAVAGAWLLLVTAFIVWQIDNSYNTVTYRTQQYSKQQTVDCRT